MKKFVAFSMGAMMALGFSACSDDDIVDPTPTLSSDATAYMHVNIIMNDDASTRADDVSPTLYVGSENEHKVSKMEFYFFDAKKQFLSRSTYSDATFTANTEGDNNNIETQSTDIILVPEYDPTNPPKYVITVLNATEDLEMVKGEDITKFYALADGAFAISEELEKDPQNSARYSIGDSKDNSFVMTTSTYMRSGSSVCPNYATDLTDATFFETLEKAQADDAKSKYTNIYVERLAAKVVTDFSDNVKAKWTKFGENVFRLGYFDLNNTGKGKIAFYAHFTKWGLDGTAKQTYYSKHIDEAWATTLLGDANPWNDEYRYRSYWAQSVYYNSGTTTAHGQEFPDKYYDTKGEKSNNYWQSASEVDYYKGFSLNFINANETDQTLGQPLYCGENTNSGTFLSHLTNIAGAATTVLMKAQLMRENAAGDALESTGDIVKYAGNYYDADTLSAKFLAAINATDYYFKNAEAAADAAYEKLTETELTYGKDTSLLNGRVRIKVDTLKVDKDAKFYQAVKTTSTNEAGESVTSTSYKEIEGVTVASIDAALDDIQGAHPMVKYTDGWMYYYTTIYHLSNNAIANKTIPEGYYGVVRNHWYNVTITGFRKTNSDGTTQDPYDPKNPDNDDDETGWDPEGPGKDKDPIDPGHGVDDPDEPIVPTTEEDVNYYLGANINVLSWRVVNQSVKL
jgi:hypothetical protein